MTALVGAVATAFRARDPQAVVLFSVTIYPFANYSKASPAVFDYGAIAQHCDFIFVMGYDTFGWPKTAHGGGMLPDLTSGLRQYAKLGVPRSKLVIGVGLFAFDFTCDGTAEPTVDGCSSVRAGAKPSRAPDSDTSTLRHSVAIVIPAPATSFFFRKRRQDLSEENPLSKTA